LECAAFVGALDYRWQRIMAANIEQELLDRVRALPIEKQRELLHVVETLEESPAPAKTIWEEIRDIMSDVPEEVWAQMPHDGSEQHDHYLYGTPKK
jgi:hypothetical protein